MSWDWGRATKSSVTVLPEKPGGTAAEVASVFRAQPGASRVIVRRGEGVKAEPLLSRDLPGSAAEFGYLPKLTVLAEALSRNEFPAALKAIGVSGKPNPVRAARLSPAKVDDRLGQLGFVENLSAVRDLHETIRVDGESSARLGALARGYVQLGVLSEFHWHPAHKAFKARALLYAQRLAAREPESPWGLWNRAFVLALVGLPRDAQTDLDEARKLADARQPHLTPPDWVGVIEAYLARDAERLRLDNGPHRKLAALLRMMVFEYPTWTSVALQAAKDVVGIDPECYRAHELMCRVGGVANLHVATELGPATLARLLPEKLDALPSLPTGVRQALARGSDEPALLDALAHADQPAGEPSWAVLAHLVRETRFVQVYRRLDFLRLKLVVPVDEFWDHARPEVAGHRFRAFLETYAQSPQDARQTILALLKQLDPTDLECTAIPLIQDFGRADPIRGARSWSSAMSHCDTIVRDISQLLEATVQPGEVRQSRPGLAGDQPALGLRHESPGLL